MDRVGKLKEVMKMTRENLTKLMEDREEFFKNYSIECSCSVGRYVCNNCIVYYAPLGRLRLKIRSWCKLTKKG